MAPTRTTYLRSELDRARADARSWASIAEGLARLARVPARVREQLPTVARRMSGGGDGPRVYVAASSKPDQLIRAGVAMQGLALGGAEVTSTWAANVRDVGAANPRDASRDQRAAWASVCLAEILSSDVVLVLVPPVGNDSAGAWWEVGVAHWLGHRVIAAGDCARSIFLGLVDHEVRDDADAIALCLAQTAGGDR